MPSMRMVRITWLLLLVLFASSCGNREGTFLTILRIESRYPKEKLLVHITATVNDHDTLLNAVIGTKWIEIGPDMPVIRTRVKRSDEGYEIGFRMDAKHLDFDNEFRGLSTVRIEELPFEGEVELYQFSMLRPEPALGLEAGPEGIRMRSSESSLTIRFRLAREPR